MITYNEMDLVIKYSRRFGEIAIMKGFITAGQEEEALAEQSLSYPSTKLRPHKLIGEILLEKGWMTFAQIFIVLEELSKNQKQHP
jgi:hypothetical protein